MRVFLVSDWRRYGFCAALDINGPALAGLCATIWVAAICAHPGTVPGMFVRSIPAILSALAGV